MTQFSLSHVGTEVLTENISPGVIIHEKWWSVVNLRFHLVTLPKNLIITVLLVRTRIECTWYREVYPKLMISIRGCSTVFGRVSPTIFGAGCAQFFKNGVFPPKFNSKCSNRQLSVFQRIVYEFLGILIYSFLHR